MHKFPHAFSLVFSNRTLFPKRGKVASAFIYSLIKRAEMSHDHNPCQNCDDAPCKCCLSIFTNVKVLIINRDSSSAVFCRCFTFKAEYLSSFVTNVIFFIKAFSRLGISLFRNPAKPVILLSTVLTVLLLTVVFLVSRFHCVCLKADLHGTTLSHATSLRQAYDMNCFV